MIQWPANSQQPAAIDMSNKNELDKLPEGM